MQFTKLKKSGKLTIDFQNLDGLGEIVTKSFLSGVVERVAIRTTEYFDETGDYVFRYKERQIHSVLCPAIADVTPSYLIEHPLERKPVGEEKYRGHVDYWAMYRRLSYLIELKHAFQAYSEDTPRKSICKKFSRAIRQLKDVRTDECEYLCGDNKKLLKIALETVTFYKGSKVKEKLTDIKDSEIIDCYNSLKKSRSLNNMNIYALWLADKRMTQPFEYSNCFEIYPAVAFFAKIF